jgi:hypothetical protein
MPEILSKNETWEAYGQYIQVGSAIYMACYLLIILLVCGKRAQADIAEKQRLKDIKINSVFNNNTFHGLTKNLTRKSFKKSMKLQKLN